MNYRSRASLSRGIPAHRKSSFAINSFLQSVSQFTNSVLSFDLIKFLKNSWSRGRDLTPERDHSADIFKRKVPEVAPELLCNNIRNLSPNPITSNGNSKTRHRQNRKSKSSPPHQSTPSKMSMKNELRRNKVPPVEPLPPMSWTINAPESPKRTKVIDDDKLDTASASSVESSRSRGSSVSSGNMESDHKKRNDDNSSKCYDAFCNILYSRTRLLINYLKKPGARAASPIFVKLDYCLAEKMTNSSWSYASNMQ